MKRWMLLLVVLLLVGCEPVVEPSKHTALGPGIDIIEQHDPWVDGGCILTIGESERTMIRQNDVDTSTIGETTILYEVDYGIETYQCQRIVKVVDRSAPTVSLVAGVDTVQVNDIHIDAGVTAQDNSDSELDVTAVSTVDTTRVGTYTITYVVTDDSGNTTQIVRYVTVRDDRE